MSIFFFSPCQNEEGGASGPLCSAVSEDTFKNHLDKVYTFFLTQPDWVERSKVKQEQCVLNMKAIDFSSSGKLKVEDDQGQIVCTLRGVEKMEGGGGMVAWCPQLGWNRILTYISAFFFFFRERKQLLPSCSWQKVVKVFKVVWNISGWDTDD